MTDTVEIVERMPRGRANGFWTEERVAELRDLLEVKGWSGSEAGRHFGKSKNAIIGIAERQKIRFKGRAFQTSRRNAQRPPREPRPVKPPRSRPGPPPGQQNPGQIVRKSALTNAFVLAIPKHVPYVESADLAEYNAAPVPRKRLWELNHGECKWPVGESGGLHQCCAQRTWKDGANYCAFHARAATRS